LEKCLRCKYYRGIRRNKHYCFAFPHGIPDKIFNGEHLKVVPEQRGDYVFTVGSNPKLVVPYSEKNMERPQLFGRDNLCSTLRDIYLKTDDPEIKLWTRISIRMAKNMYAALSDYKEMLLEAGYSIGHDSREDWQLRKRTLKVEK